MPEETHRHCMEAQRTHEYGGGACSLLVRRVPKYYGTGICGYRVELLFHADPATGASLTDEQALRLAEALNRATAKEA